MRRMRRARTKGGRHSDVEARIREGREDSESQSDKMLMRSTLGRLLAVTRTAAESPGQGVYVKRGLQGLTGRIQRDKAFSTAVTGYLRKQISQHVAPSRFYGSAFAPHLVMKSPRFRLSDELFHRLPEDSQSQRDHPKFWLFTGASVVAA